MQKEYRILVIVPKETETTIGIFHNDKCLFKNTLSHFEQTEMSSLEINNRKNRILDRLMQAGINISKLDAVSATGGIIQAVEGGTYLVNEKMAHDLASHYNGKHASNFGGLIAKKIADGLNIAPFIVDPPVVDEMKQIARYSGTPAVERKSIFHALNHKAASRKAATALGATYDKLNLIVAHIGNGISIGAHQLGRVIDVNNGLYGDGPFSLDRSGSLPLHDLIEMSFQQGMTKDKLIHQLTFQGGLHAYLAVQSFQEVEEKLSQEDLKTTVIMQAMGYQIAKEIGAMATVLGGNIDGIVLTGEFAGSVYLTDFISDQVNWIADLFIYPGEAEMETLNRAALRVLKEEEPVKIYEDHLVIRGGSI